MWLDPFSFPLVLLRPVGFFILMILLRYMLTSTRYLHLRGYLGVLSGFYLDALLGLITIRTHSAERGVRREYDKRVIQWAHPKLKLHHLEWLLDAVDYIIYNILVISIIFFYLWRGQELIVLPLLLYLVYVLV